MDLPMPTPPDNQFSSFEGLGIAHLDMSFPDLGWLIFATEQARNLVRGKAKRYMDRVCHQLLAVLYRNGSDLPSGYRREFALDVFNREKKGENPDIAQLYLARRYRADLRRSNEWDENDF